MRVSTITIAIAALGASIVSAAAQQPQVRAGLLQCQGGQNVGFVVGSVTSFQCVFESEGRRPEPYLATVRRYGVDLGFTDQTRLVWAVNAPTRRVGRGDLAGSYGGVGANASVGVGFGGNFLVGWPAKSLRAAADQPAGPDRVERRGRHRRYRAAAVPARARRQAPPASQASPSRLKRQSYESYERPAKAGLFFVRCLIRHEGVALQIWHACRRCVIESRAPGQWRTSDSPLASHLSAGDFPMSRSTILAGLAATSAGRVISRGEGAAADAARPGRHPRMPRRC